MVEVTRLLAEPTGDVRIGTFLPETKKFLTWPIPSGGGTVRNMEVDKNGNLWLAESGVGRIARVTIKTGSGTR